MGRRGENTHINQRRANLRNSRRKLEGLLAANFQNGAQLVTLTYTPDLNAPSRRLAVLQLDAWLRSLKNQQGQLRYIRATEQAQDKGGYPVHRVVLILSEAFAPSLPTLWAYGPTRIESIQGIAPEALADFLMAQALKNERVDVPCGRAWSPSAGLIRPRKENTKL